MSRRATALFSLLLSLGGTARGADFDFYVLALSWSPAWCETKPASESTLQCGGEIDFGFVVHGLWPQFETGYPEFCGERGRLPRPLVDSMLDIMPDPSLVAHEWRKHGTCAGAPAKDYFAATRAAFERVSIPTEFHNVREGRTVSAAEVEAAFVAANPGLSAEGIAVACRDGRVTEVRICLEPNLGFRSCEEVDTRGCRQTRLRLSPND